MKPVLSILLFCFFNAFHFLPSVFEFSKAYVKKKFDDDLTRVRLHDKAIQSNQKMLPAKNVIAYASVFRQDFFVVLDD